MTGPALAALLERLHSQSPAELLQLGWCDLHGTLRGKTLVLGADDASRRAVASVLGQGVGMVGTLLLKDTADRTAWPVFETGVEAGPSLQRLAGASNVLLHADPDSLQRLPWAPQVAWLRGQLQFAGGVAVPLDTRWVLQQALAALAAAGYQLTIGLEVEFHIHRLVPGDDGLGVDDAGWPPRPPAVRHSHAGYRLLGLEQADALDEPLAIVRRTAQALALPLRSLEIEFGPSQVEAVFDAQDALAAADAAVLFRSAVRQALRRAGWLASFVCRPPLPHSVASGWHLHQSLRTPKGANAFVRPAGLVQTDPGDAAQVLSPVGVHWLAGLQAHAQGMAALCAPSLVGASRFAGSAMAPQAAVWGFDNRGAMLRVVGQAGDAGTRIENRLPEPMANPYLTIASQVWAGLDGLQRGLHPGPACTTPYADLSSEQRLPQSLAQALDALAADPVLQRGLGTELAAVFNAIKRQEISRFEAAEDQADWLAREYFGRY